MITVNTNARVINPFHTDEGIDRMVCSLEQYVSDIACFFDASISLGFPIRYLEKNPVGLRDDSQMQKFSKYYERLNPIFRRHSIITPRVKHAMIREIFHGRIALIEDESPSAKQLDRHLDLLHRAVCHKESYIPRTITISMATELDSELLSAVYELASRRNEIIGFATRSRNQAIKIRECSEKAAADGRSLPIELISYNPADKEYQRKSLYKTADVMALM